MLPNKARSSFGATFDNVTIDTTGTYGFVRPSAEDIPKWRLPIFGYKIGRVPAFLVPRLTEMAKDLPGTDLDHRIYYERVNALLVVAASAREWNPAAFNLDEPPSDTERRFGSTLGQAFHQGCSLADVSFAARSCSARKGSMLHHRLNRDPGASAYSAKPQVTVHAPNSGAVQTAGSEAAAMRALPLWLR